MGPFPQLSVAAAVGWSLDPGLLAAIAAIGAGYALRIRTLRRAGHHVPGWRQGCFAAGLALVGLALFSPIDELGEERLFYVHMIQHLMLGDLAPLAIVLGLTGPVLRPVLALAPVRRLRGLAHPLVALPLWALSLCAWHLPAPYEAALSDPAVHALEHLSFFAAGALMWAAVIEPLPGPEWFGTAPKAAYVLVVRTVGAVLGNVFIWAGEPLYQRYGAGERIAGIAPLTDQRIAGAIMFTEGAIVTLVAFAWLFLRWTREAELRQALEDSGHDPRVAARAARYGRRALDPAAPPQPQLGTVASGGARSGSAAASRSASSSARS